MKESVEEENERLKAELNELRGKTIDCEKKTQKYKSEMKELQGQVGSLQKENKSLKDEITELVFNGKKNAKKVSGGKVSAKK